MSARRLWLSVLIAAGTAASQTHSIQGPQLGLVFDEAAGALRPIVGIAGSSTMGDPLPLNVALKSAIVSPSQDYALAVNGRETHVRLILPRQNSIVLLKPLPEANRAPDRMVISPTGSAAAFYYYNGRAAGSLVVMNGFPDAPHISARMTLSRVFAPTTMAVADDGAVVLAGRDHWVIAITEAAEIPVTSTLGKVASLAFITGHDALIADGEKNEVYLLRGAAGAGAVSLLAGPDQEIAGPVSVAASSDGRTAFVANSKTNAVVIFDLAGTAPRKSIDCRCQLTGLDRLTDGSLFRLNNVSQRPLWLLDASPARVARVLFVPPPSSSRSVQQ
jgi:DNA-binding beta-propeller fold protein YncE